MLSPWTVRGSRHALKDRWISVRADDCATASGAVLDPYYVLEFPDFVHVVATDHADRVVMIRQYRHGLGQASLELPGGHMDPGDRDIVSVARRELREETGFCGGRFEHVAGFSPDPARYSNRLHLVRATGVVAGPPQPDDTEEIETVLLDRREALRLASSGGIVHAAHVGLLFVGLG